MRLVENPQNFDAVHWDPEPTSNPSQEENRHDADECLLPSWEGSGVGRFMESPLSLFRMHWDHEPVWAIQSAAAAAHSKTWRKCARLSPTR